MDGHPGLDPYLSADYLHHIKDAHHRSAGARLLMESSPLQMLLVARMEGKRPEQVTLGLLALPLTCHGSSRHTVRLNFKAGGEMQPYYVPREKERH